MNISWENIIAGDKKTYSEAYVAFYDRFYNYGRKFTDDAALIEDAIQEVLITLWVQREKLAGIPRRETYFFASFRHALFKKIKKSFKQLPIEMGNWEPEFSQDAILVNQETGRELQQKLEKALVTLTSRQREAIFLRFYEGLSYEEVAETLGITVKATYKIVARGLLQLKEQMALSMLLLLMLLRYRG